MYYNNNKKLLNVHTAPPDHHKRPKYMYKNFS